MPEKTICEYLLDLRTFFRYMKMKEDGKEVYSPYIEVMLPKSNFGLSEYDDDTALKMLQEAGADELIGYRIPTEGKQSIALLNVVGCHSLIKLIITVSVMLSLANSICCGLFSHSHSRTNQS